jgi:hypothetical protein
MEIKIDKEPITTARLNLDAFKKDLAKGWNILKAVMDNLTITSTTNESADEDSSKKVIFYGTDWGSFLMMFEVSQPKTVDFRVYKAAVDGTTVYTPDKIDTSDGVVHLKNHVVSKMDFLITNSLSKRIDKNIEVMLSGALIDYVNYEWNVIVDMEAE